MRIVEVDINNFRGIKSFKETFYDKNLICLIGRGDSGKSTILEAIYYALYPHWNLQLNDNDFHKGDTSNPIKIEVSIKVPVDFISEDKYGLYLRGYNKEDGKIYDELKDNHEKVLTISLEIDKNLEPKWYIYNQNQDENYKEINHKDRAKLNCFIVSDYVDKHFTWGVGTPLRMLSNGNANIGEYQSRFLEPMRDSICQINGDCFSDLDKCFTDLVSSDLISTQDTKTLMELKDITYSINNLSLHDKNDIPYRLKGKGSKRLLSVEIQLATTKEGSITLIDEIEQGLEPDRVRKLVGILKKKLHQTDSQIFITTHSNNVLAELGADNIYIIRRTEDKNEAIEVASDLASLVRSCPEAFFAKKLIVCEGKTELGLCRAIDNYIQKQDKPSMSYHGCVCVLGEGSSFAKKSEHFKNLGFDTHIFCDSDVLYSPDKNTLQDLGVIISDCEQGNCIEKQVFSDLPFNAITELVNYVIKDAYNSDKNSFLDSMKSKNSAFSDNWETTDTESVRNELADRAKEKEWFKRIDHGEFLGNIIFKYWAELSEEKCLKKQLNQVIGWVEE